MSDKSIDVAIVGAGVSGLYSAWRLQGAKPNQTIAVFEASDRVGGRLLSVRPPGIPNMVAELGGMRILPEIQPRIKRLLEVLNKQLPSDRKINTFDFPVDEPQNLAYLRGAYLRLSDFTHFPEKVPYALTFLERGMKPAGLILSAIEQIVPGVTQPGLTEEQRRELARKAEFAGKPLYQQGFWNVLMRAISGEAYLLGVDAGGYNTTLINWNASDAVPWYLSDFGVSARYQGFCKGFQEVPESLAELFEKAGGRIQLSSPLAGFTQTEAGFELHVGGKTVAAKALILAMPRRSLELLAPSSPSLEGIRELIESVTPRPLFKLFTTYRSPWWRSAGYIDDKGQLVAVEAGRSVTDLPVRQTYYWPHNDGSAPKEGPAMLLASYDDGGNIGFWDGLRPRRRETSLTPQQVSPPTQAFQGSQPGRPATTWDLYQAPKEMVAEVTRQLGKMHGLAHTPEIVEAAYRDWGEDPYGGGWNSWNIGVRSWEVKTQIIQPLGVPRLFICGEAYSDAQGWVEGALQTADLVLEKFLLPPL